MSVGRSRRGRTLDLMGPIVQPHTLSFLPKPPKTTTISGPLVGGIGTKHLPRSGTLVCGFVRRSHVECQSLARRFRMGVFGGAVAALLGAVPSGMAQALKDVKTADKPLVLKAQGSFFVGGEKVEQTARQLGDLGPGGHITVNQMYVRYMVPQGGD